eukprot:10129-Heterococcus_DN1.PRE.2
MASKRAGKLEQRSAVPVATQAREHCADVSNGTPSAISNVQFACESMLARFQHLELAETNMCKLFHSSCPACNIAAVRGQQTSECWDACCQFDQQDDSLCRNDLSK